MCVCVCVCVCETGVFRKRPLERTTNYPSAMSRATASRALVKADAEVMASPLCRDSAGILSDTEVTPLVARILAESQYGTLNVKSHSGFLPFGDLDAASLVTYLEREARASKRHMPIATVQISVHVHGGDELRSRHAVAVIDACAELGTIHTVSCAVHPRDKMDDHATALARWLRDAERPPLRVALYWSWNDARLPKSRTRISDTAAADLFRSSTGVRFIIRSGYISIHAALRDRAEARASAAPAASPAPQTFAFRLACVALEASGGVSELRLESACINDDDAAALLDRVRRFGSSMEKLILDSRGRALLEGPTFDAVVRTLPKLHLLAVKCKESMQPEALRGLAAAMSASKTLTEVILSGVGITSASCGAWHDMLTRAPALTRFTIDKTDLTDADRTLLLRGAAFSRNACTFYIFGTMAGFQLHADAAKMMASARLRSAERFMEFAGAEMLCDAKSPARRFLEGDGDRAIAWRVLRLLGVQP